MLPETTQTPAATPWIPTHATVAGALAERRRLDAAEARTVLLDGLRPFAAFMRAYEANDPWPDEASTLNRGALSREAFSSLKIAERLAHDGFLVANEVHGLGTDDDGSAVADLAIRVTDFLTLAYWAIAGIRDGGHGRESGDMSETSAVASLAYMARTLYEEVAAIGKQPSE